MHLLQRSKFLDLCFLWQHQLDYMTGSLRSWIHYIDLRSAHGTQKEHMDIANGAKEIFIEQFPTISTALEWI